jgi:hypothetical protein
MLDIVYCLRYISYLRCFGSWLCSRFRMNGCLTATDRFITLYSVCGDKSVDHFLNTRTYVQSFEADAHPNIETFSPYFEYGKIQGTTGL